MDKLGLKRAGNDLAHIYYHPSNPASFTSVHRLKRAANKKNTIREIQDWLATQDTYTLHRSSRKRFPRNPYIVFNRDDLWEADLTSMEKVAKYNRGFRYLLNVIDVFSRYAWSVPIKNKSAESIVKAFKSILRKSKERVPLLLQTDKGKEFMNRKFQTFLQSKNIEFRHTNNPDIKASYVEIFNRTLKRKIYKYFTFTSKFHYLPVLDALVSSYNHAIHSTLGMPPERVHPENILQVWNRLKQNRERRQKIKKVKFQIGDIVRISKEKMYFAKGYERNFTRELFKINRVIRKVPEPVYEIVDLQERPIQGQFYSYELVKASLPPVRSTKGSNKRAGKRR